VYTPIEPSMKYGRLNELHDDRPVVAQALELRKNSLARAQTPCRRVLPALSAAV
jgi:hypothetical protein